MRKRSDHSPLRSARYWLAGLLLLFAAGQAEPAAAFSDDQDKARGAVRSGEALPLGQIMRRVRPSYPGQLLDAQISRKGKRGPWVYDLKVLTPDGREQRLKVDGRSGRVLGVRGR